MFPNIVYKHYGNGYSLRDIKNNDSTRLNITIYFLVSCSRKYKFQNCILLYYFGVVMNEFYLSQYT
jgi:hypothetical protein